MAVQFHVLSAFSSWRLDRAFLRRLETVLERNGLRVGSVHAGADADETFADLASIPLEPPPTLHVQGLGEEGVFVDLTLHREARTDADGLAWNLWIDLPARLFADEGFSALRLAEDLHVSLGASKSVGYGDWGPPQEKLQAAYEAIGWPDDGDPALDPVMDFAVFDPAPHGHDLMTKLIELHRRWAEALGQAPGEPLPVGTRALANGHLFVQWRRLS